MKKFLLVIAAASMMFAASASEVRTVVKARGENISAGCKQAVSHGSRADVTSAILETPAGREISNLTMSEFALYPVGFEIYQRMLSGKVTSIVEGTDGAIYVKSPVGVYPTEGWLKLDHVEGTVYEARLPQKASAPWDYEGEEVCFNYDRLDFDEDEGYYYPSFGESTLSFNYENGVLTSIGELGEDMDMPVMLGLTYDIYGPDEADEAWAWFGVNNITVAPMTDAVVEIPDGVKAEKMVMASTQGEYSVRTAVDGNRIYLSLGESLGYAVGTVADGVATFTSNQYIGISGGYHCYFYGGYSEFVEDEDYADGGYTVYRPADDIVFVYDKDGVFLQSEGALIVNEGNLSTHAAAIYDKPVVTAYQAVEAAPSNPEIIRYDEYDDWDEYGVIFFNLPTTSVDGQIISKTDLYYNVFVEGSDEPYVFEPALYELISEPVVNVPYNFSDGYDFSVNGERHTVVIYDDLGVLGVQSVNVTEKGVYRSDIVWTNGAVSGIESVVADGDGDSAPEFYDLTGRRVVTPSEGGIYIRRQGSDVSKVTMIR